MGQVPHYVGCIPCSSFIVSLRASSQTGVAIDHGDYVVLYAEIDHNLKIGDKVKQGQVIGQMKKGPNYGTLMLHLEVFIGGYGGWSEHNQYREDPTYIYYLPNWRD